MKTLKNMILALVAVSFISSPSYSDGADSHKGLYLGVMTAFNGVELDGKYQQATDSTTAQAGKYAQIESYQQVLHLAKLLKLLLFCS